MKKSINFKKNQNHTQPQTKSNFHDKNHIQGGQLDSPLFVPLLHWAALDSIMRARSEKVANGVILCPLHNETCLSHFAHIPMTPFPHRGGGRWAAGEWRSLRRGLGSGHRRPRRSAAGAWPGPRHTGPGGAARRRGAAQGLGAGIFLRHCFLFFLENFKKP